jgi:hypothetical protein
MFNRYVKLPEGHRFEGDFAALLQMEAPSH